MNRSNDLERDLVRWMDAVAPRQAPDELIHTIDSARVEQVVTNLLENAIKYAPDGGEIEVTVSRAEDEELQISVRDHGLGIPVERRDRIFERFYQAHNDGYRSGMGLGLYVSQQIMELHRGRLSVEFPDDGGSRFVAHVPARAPAEG